MTAHDGITAPRGDDGAPMRGAQRHGQRRERTDGKILRAALDIIIAQGIGAVTIEAVARRSGVAKTTIYRRYANREDLIHHLTSAIVLPLDFDDVEPTHAGLRTVLCRIVDCFDDRIGLTAVGVVLSSSNDHLRALADGVLRPACERFCTFLTRGVDAGTYRRGLDIPFLFRTVLGSMLACKALGDPRDSHEAWASHMTELLWPAIRA